VRTRFHLGLDLLKQKLLTMGGMAEQAVERAIEAYRRRDAGFCQQVLEAEPAINLMEREIDELALDLLAMQQPMAIDLRFITAVMKINADLERVGDQGVNIVQRVLHSLQLPDVDLPADIPRMAELSADMVRRSLQSFIDARPEAADEVLKMDDLVDNMNREIHAAMVNHMRLAPDSLEQALDALLIARNLERVADHATNIAEDVIFWIKGADVRHHFGMNAVQP
jgi:phosphate transport system protein